MTREIVMKRGEESDGGDRVEGKRKDEKFWRNTDEAKEYEKMKVVIGERERKEQAGKTREQEGGADDMGKFVE